MRLHRFYVKEKIVGESIIVTDEKLIHQWRDVFRLSAGDRVILFDGSENEITLFKKNKIPIVSLGELTLRTETAAVVGVSIFLIK